MQPGPNPEDIQTILSRFQTWAEKHPPNGNGNGHKDGDGSDELREIPYEEAIRQLRSREAPPARRPARARVRAGAQSGQKPPVKAGPVAPPPEEMPAWISQLPVVPETEPIIELRSASPEVKSGKAEVRFSPSVKPADPELKFASELKSAAAVLSEALRDRGQFSAPINGDTPIPPPPPQAPAVRQAPGPKQARNPERPQPPLTAAAADIPPELPAKRTQPAAAAPGRRPALKTRPSPAPVKRKTTPVQRASPRVAAPAKTAPRRPRTQPVQNRTRSSLIEPQARIAARTPAQATAGRKRAASARTRKPERPPFRQVLANTVQHPRIAPAPKKKLEPDRTRRITTRFTSGEERRIEKQAAEFGITVSAFLRQCALAALAAQNAPQESVFSSGMQETRAARASSSPLRSYSSPAPSLLGGWLSLLRNRFLGPPIRFSEEA